MRVFVTGATGFIGSAVVRELLGAGHQVIGLARSDDTAERLARTGAQARRGDLTDGDSLAEGARDADGVIHTAFIHDFEDYQKNAEIDRAAVATLAEALAVTGKPLVSTSVSVLLKPGTVGHEADQRAPDGPLGARAGSEAAVLQAADHGVRASVVRLPPSVHGAGDHGFVPALIDIARRAGFAAYVGEGENRWAAVHRDDAARLFRLALEGAAPGAVLHAVAEGGIPTRAIADAIGRGLDVPVRGVAAEQADEHFGWLAGFAALDNPMSSAATRERYEWRPEMPDLLTDMAETGYFETAKASA